MQVCVCTCMCVSKEVCLSDRMCWCVFMRVYVCALTVRWVRGKGELGLSAMVGVRMRGTGDLLRLVHPGTETSDQQKRQ